MLVYSRKWLYLIATIVGVLFFFWGAESHRTQKWPFGRGYYEWVRVHTDFNGRYADKKAKILQQKQVETLKKQEEARQVEEDRVNHVQTSTLHRMRQRLVENVPEGQIYILHETPEEISFILLTLRNPTILKGLMDVKNSKVKLTTIGLVGRDSVRGTDIVKDPLSGKVYTSYVTTDKRNCSSLEVAEVNLEAKPDEIITKVIFQPQCLLAPNTILETGGRMAFDDQQNMYLTVGDFGKGYTVDQQSSYFGKTLVRHKNQAFEIFSLGHRNSQGMHFDKTSRQLIQTEHGPQGGDEINNILKGVHYGWPHDTYGTDYSINTESQQFQANKGDVMYGHHDRYKKPIYAFTPSIGIAEIHRFPKTQWEFPGWREDWLIAGMATGQLYRAELLENRVLQVESISITSGNLAAMVRLSTVV